MTYCFISNQSPIADVNVSKLVLRRFAFMSGRGSLRRPSGLANVMAGQSVAACTILVDARPTSRIPAYLTPSLVMCPCNTSIATLPRYSASVCHKIEAPATQPLQLTTRLWNLTSEAPGRSCK